MKRHQTANRQLPFGVSVALLLLSVSIAAQRVVPTTAPAVVPEKLKGYVPVTDDMLLRPTPENWISFRNGYNLWGYSSLNQINAANVHELRLVWSLAMQPGPQEIVRAPRVYRHHSAATAAASLRSPWEYSERQIEFSSTPR